MSFYTLTFKTKIVISVLITILMYILINIFIHLYFELRTSKVIFTDNKFSKLKHYTLQDKRNLIFMGSSRTFYGVSTNTFNMEFKAYNFGIAGMKLEDFPTLINTVAKDNYIEYLIINVSVDDLYRELDIAKYPRKSELDIYKDIDFQQFILALKEFVASYNYFYNYSEAIYFKMVEFYKKFNFSEQNNKNQIIQQNDNHFIIDNMYIDCEVFKTIETINRATKQCTNGDGILFGNNIDLNNTPDTNIKLKDLSVDIKKYIQKMVEPLSNNIKVLMVLEPRFNYKYKYNINEIEDFYSDVNIIDMTNTVNLDKYWADNGHLNAYGRLYYSYKLLNKLKEYKK